MQNYRQPRGRPVCHGLLGMSGVVVDGFIVGKIIEAESCAFGGALLSSLLTIAGQDYCGKNRPLTTSDRFAPRNQQAGRSHSHSQMTRGKTFERVWNPFPCNPNSGGYGVDRHVPASTRHRSRASHRPIPRRMRLLLRRYLPAQASW
jgi:hypothetical protein